MQWQPGYKLKKRPYEIEKVLGEGGFGITYKAKHLNFDIPVVIKTPNSKLQKDSNYQKFVESFKREGKQLAKIGLNRHPHIVRVSDFFNEDNLPCIVMDFIEGKNLYDLVLTEGKLIEQRAVKYIKQIASALTTCHQAGIIHRDVSPLNIIISNRTEEAILIDFGISMSLQTARHTYSGNRGFAPWEQMAHWEKHNSKTPQVDIYALAATLYFLVTGQIPLECLARKYNNEELIEPNRLNTILSKVVNDAILKGMEVLPENRPNSLQEWLQLISATPQSSINSTQAATTSVNQNVPERGDKAKKRQFQVNNLKKYRVNNFSFDRHPISNKPIVSSIKYPNKIYKLWKNSKLRNSAAALISTLLIITSGYVVQNRHTLILPVVSDGIKLENTMNAINVNNIAFDRNGQTLAIVSRNVKLWKSFMSWEDHQEETATIADYSDNYMEIESVVFNPQIADSHSDTIAIHIRNGSDDEIKLLDFITKEEIATIPDCRTPVFSPDGQTLAMIGKDNNNLNTIKLWNLNTEKEIAATGVVVSSAQSGAFSPDARTIAVGGYRDIELWDLDTKQEVATLTSHLDGVFSVAFSRDGQTLVSASYDKTIKVWDVENKKAIATLTGFSGGLESMAFSPNGRTIAVGGWKNIELWDLDTKQKIATIGGHSKRINSIAFNFNGETLATSSHDNTVKIWNIPPDLN